MPVSASSFHGPNAAKGATGTGILGTPQRSNVAHYGVVPFRRDASGAIVPGAVLEVPNAEIAWRCARAAASDHGNVGAVELRDGVLLAYFGEVDLNALPG